MDSALFCPVYLIYTFCHLFVLLICVYFSININLFILLNTVTWTFTHSLWKFTHFTHLNLLIRAYLLISLISYCYCLFCLLIFHQLDPCDLLYVHYIFICTIAHFTHIAHHYLLLFCVQFLSLLIFITFANLFLQLLPYLCIHSFLPLLTCLCTHFTQFV